MLDTAGILSALLQSGSAPSTQSFLGSNPAMAFGQTPSALAPGQSTAPGGQATTPLSQIVVQSANRQRPMDASGISTLPPSAPSMAPAPMTPGVSQDAQSVAPQTASGPNVNYNNSGAIDAVHQSLTDNQPQPGGMTAPGLYGLLPKSMQHGTLRGVLGAIGDAFLVRDGQAPAYANSQARQQIGNAMAGIDYSNPQSVDAATQRMEATGAPGAIEAAQKVREDFQNYKIKEELQEQALWWHEQQSHDKEQNSLNRIQFMGSGPVKSAQTAEQYAQAYAQMEAAAQRVGPDYHAADMGLVPPDQWRSGMYADYGETGNNVQQSTDRRRGQDTSLKAAGVRAGATIGAAGIGANKPTEGTLLAGAIARVKAGTADDTDKALVAHATETRRPQRGLILGATTQQQQFQNGKVYHDAHGNKAMYQNGKWIPQ